MKRIGVALAAVVVSGAVVPAASAAMCVRLFTQPCTGVVGVPMVVGLRTYAPYPDGLRPWIVTGYPFRVRAVAPNGRVYRVSIRPGHANLWAGSFSFPVRGVWTVRVDNFGPRYPKGCGETLRLRILPR